MINPRIKTFLVFLTVVAALSVMSFLDVFKGVRSALIHDAVKPLEVDLIQDTDSDGLSDSDESYWNTNFEDPDSDDDGFLDGEEVASGHDPREKSTHPQGDSLGSTVYGGLDPDNVDPDFNITDAAGQLLAGAISAGDLTRTAEEGTQDESVDMIALSVVNNFYTIQKSFPVPEIKTTDNSKDNQLKYLRALYDIIKDDLLDFPQKLNAAASVDSQMPYFKARGDQFSASFNRVSNLEVPNDWLDIHKNILNILQRFAYNYNAIANYETDILKATAAFNEVAAINMEAQTLIQSIQIKATTNSLVLDDDMYQILNILYAN